MSEETVNIANPLHQIFHKNGAARLLIKDGTLMAVSYTHLTLPTKA